MHDLTDEHINYATKVMNVKLAVQTLSHRTANALKHLVSNNFYQFKGAEAMIKYIQMCANIWKIFNTTKKSHGKQDPLDNMMSKDNIDAIFKCFDEVEEYFKGIRNHKTIFSTVELPTVIDI